MVSTIRRIKEEKRATIGLHVQADDVKSGLRESSTKISPG
jgi:hypothetical protein